MRRGSLSTAKPALQTAKENPAAMAGRPEVETQTLFYTMIDGSGGEPQMVCLLSEYALGAIETTPGFLAPVLWPPSVAHCLVASPKMGQGLFSTREVVAEELILREHRGRWQKQWKSR
ncbi:hypothetical protein C8R44DRAFT_754668 [Mycena epipterygia]|nr:hypothetical protein C8R44DRAFT_754668 [Mycena epipterygia]